MNDEEIAIIQSVWNKLVGREEIAVSRFYGRLFEEHPEYRPLFTQSMDAQRSKFLTMLNLIVNGLDSLEALSGPLAVLAKKHSALNIKKEDYEIVANTLINAIDDVSDRPLSDADRQAWFKGLMLISSIMMQEGGKA